MSKSIVQEKSFAFSLEIIQLFQLLGKRGEYILSKQLLRCGTSIGANVEEAIAAQSRKDFVSKMSIASKEARETKYWLKLFQESKLVSLDFNPYLNKTGELILILTSIVKTTSERK